MGYMPVRSDRGMPGQTKKRGLKSKMDFKRGYPPNDEPYGE